MFSAPGLHAIAYTILDEAANDARDTVSGISYGWLIAAMAVLLFLFIVGLARKLLIFTIAMAFLALGIGLLWLYTGHSLS